GDDGRDREGRLALEQLEDLLRHGARGRRLEEDVHGSVAPEAQAEDRPVVRPGLVVEQPRLAVLDGAQRRLAYVLFEAAAADAPRGPAVVFDQELRAGTAIRGPFDADNRRQGGFSALVPERGGA